MSEASDFDFLPGEWNVRNRRLCERLAGSDEWEEFEATSVARHILGGAATRTSSAPTTAAASSACRFASSTRRLGSGRSTGPTAGVPGFSTRRSIGSFSGDVGLFHGDDTFKGRPIRVRFIWSGVTTPTPRWEQAFSDDGGETWETNWVMDFTPMEGGT